MLKQDRRIQLDGIVNKMITAGEDDETIQFVVDDFKAKYSNEPEEDNKPIGGVAGFGVGAIKGAGSTAFQSVIKPLAKIAGSVITSIGSGQTEKTDESLRQGADVRQRMIDVLSSLPKDDPKRIPLETALRSSLQTSSEISGAMSESNKQLSDAVAGIKPEGLVPQGTAQKAGYATEQIGEFFVPLGVAKKVDTAVKSTKAGTALLSGATKTGVAPKLASALTRAVGVSTENAVKTALQTGGDIKQTTGTFLLSLGMAPVAEAATKAIKKASVKMSERLYSKIFKTAEDDLRSAWSTVAKGKELDPTLAREAIDRGLKGNAKNMAIHSFQKLDDLESQVQLLAKTNKSPIKIDNKKAYETFLNDVVKQYKTGFFTERSTTASQLLKELQSSSKNTVSMDTALKLRRFIDGMRNTSTFRLDPKLSARQDEFKFAADSLRKKLSDAGLKELMNEERIYIEAIDAIVGDAAKSMNKNVIGLVDLLAGGGGMIAGGLGQGVGAAALIRGFQQPFTVTNLGQVINNIGKNAPSLAKPVTQAIVGSTSQSKR